MEFDLLTNPRSGKGEGPARAAAIAAELLRRGHGVQLHAGQSAEDAALWAAAAAERSQRLLVVGGDGSLSAALQGLPQGCPPVLLCPLGTGNAMSLELGLPSEPGQLADLAERGRTQKVDIGEANGRRCFMVMGFGMDGEIVRRIEERRSGTMRKTDYLPVILKTLQAWTPEPQRVWIDGEDLGEFDFGIVANVSTYGTWALQLGPCEYDDGLWEVYLVRRADLPGTSVAAGAALLGSLRHAPGVVHRRGREVIVQGTEASPFQVDGDFGGNTPVNFNLPGFQLPLLVPER